MFDAYTVKKVLPRLAIAVILIQLSWFLTTGAIFITNKIAFGIEGLMYGAFGGSANFTLDTLISSTSSSSATTIGLSALFVVAGTYFGGGVVAIAGFIIIALIVGFLSLAVRRAILILLVLLSPIAIVCWILPNTERFWKMWWDNFTKLLIMFPLIMAMIAAGRIFAKISGSTGSSDIVKVTIVIAGFFVPLLLIPKTFALAGSAFAAMGGAIAQRGAGAQNTVKGWGKDNQKKKWAERGHRAASGNFFQGAAEGTRRGRLNERMQNLALAKAGGWAVGNTRQQRVAAARGTTEFDHAMESLEKDAAVRAVTGNDDYLMAALHGRGTEDDAREYLEGHGYQGNDVEMAVQAIRAAKRSTGEKAFRIAATAALPGTGTALTDGPGQMLDMIDKAAGDDSIMRGRLYNSARKSAEGARRYDLMSNGFGAGLGELENIHRSTSDADRGARIQGANERLVASGLESASPGAVVGGRKQSIENFVPALVKRVTDAKEALIGAKASGDPAAVELAERNLDQTLASTKGLHNVMSQVNPEGARILADQLMGLEIEDPYQALPAGALGPPAPTTTIRALMDTRQGQPAYKEMMVTYEDAARADYARMAASAIAGGPPTGALPTTPPTSPPR